MAEFILPATDGTVEHLRDYLRMLQHERETLDVKIARVEDDILEHERRIQIAKNGLGTKRRPRGQNFATIRAVFQKHPNVTFSITDIFGLTNLPTSSIGKAIEKLEKNKRIVRDESGTGWKLAK